MNRPRNYCSAIVAAGLISACAASGPSFIEAREDIAAVPAEVARIVFFRTRDSKLYVARKATITVNGQKAGATAYGGFHYVDVAEGAHQLRADMWDAPGRCELTLVASAGRIYFFQVDPRSESFGAFSVAGFAADMISKGIVSGFAAGLVGSAAESYGKVCGGAFKLYPIDQVTSLSKLRDLNLSK